MEQAEFAELAELAEVCPTMVSGTPIIPPAPTHTPPHTKGVDRQQEGMAVWGVYWNLLYMVIQSCGECPLSK